jgi:dihydroxyacid dehydratase/phosphogluconate dehydratase
MCVRPTCGSCSFLGTANTMCCIAEAIGMSLTGSAMIPAVHTERLHAGQDSGRAVVNHGSCKVNHRPTDHHPRVAG